MGNGNARYAKWTIVTIIITSLIAYGINKETEKNLKREIIKSTETSLKGAITEIAKILSREIHKLQTQTERQRIAQEEKQNFVTKVKSLIEV